ncbi:SFT2 domain containing 2, isoform CRA_b, partial [Mus musculus]
AARTPKDRSGLSEVVEASSLSWGTRIKGFIACFALGILCSVLGTLLLWVPRKGLGLFAVFYTLGNIMSIGRWNPNRAAGISLSIPMLLLRPCSLSAALPTSLLPSL